MAELTGIKDIGLRQTLEDNEAGSGMKGFQSQAVGFHKSGVKEKAIFEGNANVSKTYLISQNKPISVSFRNVIPPH